MVEAMVRGLPAARAPHTARRTLARSEALLPNTRHPPRSQSYIITLTAWATKREANCFNIRAVFKNNIPNASSKFPRSEDARSGDGERAALVILRFLWLA